MTWTDDAFQNPKDVLAAVNPAMADVPVTDAFDRSVLENLKAIGFYEANEHPHRVGSPARSSTAPGAPIRGQSVCPPRVR